MSWCANFVIAFCADYFVTALRVLFTIINNQLKIMQLKKLRGIHLIEELEQPPIEINCHHLNCMSNSLRVLLYTGSRITFMEKSKKPFEQLRVLRIEGDVPNLPMEIEKLEHLVYYNGPMTQGMNLYEFPPSLRHMSIWDNSKNRVAYSDIPPKVTPDSSLVELKLYSFKKMQMLPDGVEKLTKLERLTLLDCDEFKGASFQTCRSQISS